MNLKNMIQDFVYKKVAKYEAIFKQNNDVNTYLLKSAIRNSR